MSDRTFIPPTCGGGCGTEPENGVPPASPPAFAGLSQSLLGPSPGASFAARLGATYGAA